MTHDTKTCVIKLRIVGPALQVIGAALLVWGLYDIFVLGNLGFHFSPFAGMLLLFFGSVLTMMGFAGVVARYQANEMAPVGRDAVNYMADGTQGGVGAIASAVAGGIRDGLSEDGSSSAQRLDCPQCAAVNDADARFCDHCGVELIRQTTCSTCNAVNDPEAHYCDHCGQPLD